MPLARSPRRLVALAGFILLIAVSVLAVRSRPIPGVRTFEIRDAAHTEGNVNYPQTPPAGGRHSSRAQPCGVFEEPVADERAVHSMELGAVWITHRPSLGAREREDLADLARDADVIVSPYPGLTRKVVASAWGVQMPAEATDDRRLRRFVDRYAGAVSGHGPKSGCP